MSELIIKTFPDELKSKSFFEHVKQRKNDLIEQYLKSAAPQLPLTRVTKLRGSTDAIFKYLEYSNPGKSFSGKGGRVKHFSQKPTRLIFQSTNDIELVCDYIAVEYYRPYLIKTDKTGIERFTYFEVYYGKCILSCLMDMSSFQNDSSFAPLDMAQGEWARLKQNMLLWNHVLYPELKRFEVEDFLPMPIEKRYHYYKNLYNNHYTECIRELVIKQPKYPQNGSDLVWPLITYVFLMLHLPALPWEFVPKFIINYNCERSSLIPDVAKWLQEYLSDSVGEIPCCSASIDIAKNWLKSKEPAGTAQPYIRILNRAQDADKTLQALHAFSIDRKSRWNMHPFTTMVPICVSSEPILDSAVLNIPVSSDNYKSLCQSEQLNPKRFLAFFASLADDTKEQDWLEMDELHKQFERASVKLLEATGRARFPAHSSASCILAIAFLSMYGREPAKFRVNDENKQWFEQQLKIWDEQTDSFNKMIQRIIRMAASDAATSQEGTPSSKEELEMVYQGRFNKEDLFCYTLESFSDRVKLAFPQANVLEVRDQLKFDGMIKCNQNRTDYNVSLGGKSQQVIAFYLDKLNDKM